MFGSRNCSGLALGMGTVISPLSDAAGRAVIRQERRFVAGDLATNRVSRETLRQAIMHLTDPVV